MIINQRFCACVDGVFFSSCGGRRRMEKIGKRRMWDTLGKKRTKVHGRRKVGNDDIQRAIDVHKVGKIILIITTGTFMDHFLTPLSFNVNCRNEETCAEGVRRSDSVSAGRLHHGSILGPPIVVYFSVRDELCLSRGGKEGLWFRVGMV